MSLLKKALLGVVGNRMTSPAHVAAVERISPRFRLIDIVSDGFLGASFEAAAKIKFDAGDWEMRTYTPIELDPATGRARILLYLHGDGPAARWAARASAGTATQTGGPKGSLDVSNLKNPILFFGDETSIAAAKTVQDLLGDGGNGRYVLEASEPEEARAASDRLDLSNLTLVARQPGDAHLAEISALLEDALTRADGAELVLTGNAQSIQRVRASIRESGIGGVRQRVKAYWAPGKVGLD